VYAPDGLYHLEVVAQVPADKVVAWLSSPDRTVKPLATVIDKGSPAGSLIPDLEAAGVEILSPTLQQLAGACGDFLDTVQRGDLRHLGDPLLAAAAKGVTRREVGDGGFAWARKSDRCGHLADRRRHVGVVGVQEQAGRGFRRHPECVVSNLQALLAVVLISVGVAFIYWPAALIVAGVLLLIDRMTD
jgi:hypothetical protein